jgi:hypothetical protein
MSTGPPRVLVRGTARLVVVQTVTQLAWFVLTHSPDAVAAVTTAAGPSADAADDDNSDADRDHGLPAPGSSTRIVLSSQVLSHGLRVRLRLEPENIFRRLTLNLNTEL